MKLYLVRHAVAAARDPERWPDDATRPLTPEGEERFRLAAKGLRTVVPRVEVVLSSPYDRAWRTAALLHDVAGWPVPTPCRELGATERPEGVLARLQAEAEASSVALVGHEPFLSQLASVLLAGDPDRASLELKKGAVALVELPGGVLPEGGRLRFLLPPRLLRALAPANEPGLAS